MSAQDSADLTFLALTVWREARGESPEARLGVAQSVMNRVKNPGWWGNSVCSVVFKRLQYSSMTDHRDPQLVNWPAPGDSSWQECLDTAQQALQGRSSVIGEADSYYDISISAPNWATEDNFIKQVGRLKFHKVGVRG